MIGETLSHFRILEKIGAGGMGVVYRAEDSRLKRQVALKVLPKEVAGSQERLRRFQREAETLATLSHPNIVTIYSVEDNNGFPFLTMELVEGERLSDLKKKGGLPLKEVFQIAIPLADALSSAHDTGVIHRDLKPSNIMIDREGRTKVLDFGLAKLRQKAASPVESAEAITEPLTDDSKVIGTLPYTSPEQIEGHSADARSDLFSLGVVLYEMSTGERPFKSKSSAGLITAIMRDMPSDVDLIRKELPHHLGRIVRRCLEKDPDRRYQDAKDVRNELADLQRELESSYSDTSRPGLPRSALTPPRARSIAVALVAIVLASLGGVAVWRSLATEKVESPPMFAREIPSDRKMIVALPFENLGPAGDEYFALGMTDEIASRLASVEGLGVISRTSAMQYKTDRPPLSQIAADLGVNYILEGSVQWQHEPSGRGRVRIILQLVRTSDDLRMWSGRYEQILDDIFVVQGEIAEEVIRELQLAIGEQTRLAMSEPLTDNLEAYKSYLRAMEYRRAEDYSEPGLEIAAQLLDRAVELDPDFSLAWAELSWVHSMIYFNDDSTDQRRALATAAMDRADQLAPDLPAVRAAAGFYYYRVNEDFNRALEEFDIALQGHPSNVDVLTGIGYVRRRLGAWDESLEILKRALELDPRSGEIANSLGETYAALREHDPATEYFHRAVTVAPDQPRFWSALAINELNLAGDVTAAREVLRQAPNPDDPHLLPCQMTLDLYEGRYETALSRLSAGDIGQLGDFNRAGVYLTATLAHELLGQEQDARRQAEQSRALLEVSLAKRPRYQYVRSRLALTYAFLGRDEDAIELGRASAEVHAGDAFAGPRFLEELAKVYVRTGRFDQSIGLLHELMSTPYNQALGPTQLMLDPIWAPLRGEPGFRSLSRSLN